jgi:hypothetical protein
MAAMGPVDPIDHIRGQFDRIDRELAEELARYNEQVDRYKHGEPAVQAPTERGHFMTRAELDGETEVNIDEQSLY